ncbi:P-loop containing nucleoside triphosphate hydrolase protein [Catenaria anguillulae PL171]|uniref:Guanylate kinase n=1 Tax=Catenaria anguillulae PL171 TaxID=765915 RepID=A0A1Y2H869_9FUNG|nr:P-loop containing nucleoside triphosphate hydrolase protein [Catenaria anguillulae PL171]
MSDSAAAAAATPLPASPEAAKSELAAAVTASDGAAATTETSPAPKKEESPAPAPASGPPKDNKRPLVVSGPSGSGKSTLLNKLFAEYPDAFGFTVSHTTRAPREGEVDGKNYHFVTREKFDSLVAEKAFLEHAEFADNMYGTSKSAVEAVTKANKICVLDIEMNGVKSIKAIAQANEMPTGAPWFVFIRPPSMDEVEKRLRARGTETDDTIAKRMAVAKAEIEYADSGAHDFQVVNDNADEAYGKLKEWVLAHYELPGAEKKGDGKKDATKDKKGGADGKKKSKFCLVQ